MNIAGIMSPKVKGCLCVHVDRLGSTKLLRCVNPYDSKENDDTEEDTYKQKTGSHKLMEQRHRKGMDLIKKIEIANKTGKRLLGQPPNKLTSSTP